MVVRRNKEAEKTSTAPNKRFVTKHSVVNRIDLSKFQSVGSFIFDTFMVA